jgi:hypothetical protein
MDASNEPSRILARRWVRRLFPLALIVVVFAGLELAARLAIWYRYGSPDFQIPENLDYAPFLITVDANPVFKFPPKTDGVTRVMIIGSSTARQIPLAIWQEVLAGRPGSRVEVLNTSQGGFSSTQELLFFLLYGLDAKPDYVISLDGLNDIIDLTKSGRAGIPYHNLAIERALHRPGLFWAERVFRRSQLVNAVRKLLERRLEVAMQSDAAANAEMTAIYRANMEKIAVLCSGIGAKYISVLQPYVYLRRDPPEVERTLGRNYLYRKAYMIERMNRLREAMRSASLSPPAVFLDATDVFDGAGELRCFRDEAHLTEAGARLLVRAIGDRIGGTPPPGSK